jgi:hypothetical protein
MQTICTLLLVSLVVAGAQPILAATFSVDCDKFGRTITKALRVARPGDTIRVSGVCEETLTITTDRVTLDGGGRAVLQGAGGGQAGDVSPGLLNIVGVQGVEIRGLTVQNSPTDGINGRQGAAFTVHNVRVLRSADDGLEATETSTVRFLGTCEIRRSGDFGMSITHGSSAVFMAERVTTAENALGGILVMGTSTAAFDTGTVHTTQNTWGFLVLGHSSLTLSRNTPTIIADANTIDGVLVADLSDLRLDGGMLTVAQNGTSGISLAAAGFINFAGTVLLKNNNEGIRAEDLSHVVNSPFGRLTIQDNTTAGVIAARGSIIRMRGEAAITGHGTDVVLSFGTLATFEGTTITSVTCDKTSLLRIDNVDVTCPIP